MYSKSNKYKCAVLLTNYMHVTLIGLHAVTVIDLLGCVMNKGNCWISDVF